MRSAPAATLLLAAVVCSGCDAAGAPMAALASGTGHVVLAWPGFVDVELSIRPLESLPAASPRPTLFVHLLDEPGSIVRTFDRPLAGDWKVGETIVDRVRLYQSALTEPLPAGDYLLSVGIHEPELGRIALRGRAREVANREYVVATVSVPAVDQRSPRARFSEQWLPPDPGGDRQLLVYRSLHGDGPGRFQFGPLDGAGTLTLGLTIPPASGVGLRMEVLDGSGQPNVRLTTDCGASEAEVTGFGHFDIDFEVPGTVAPVGCEVRVEPNFRVTMANRVEPTSARLDVVAWRAGASGPPAN